MNQLDQYYLTLPEPNKSCLLALRDNILSQHESLLPAWKWVNSASSGICCSK